MWRDTRRSIPLPQIRTSAPQVSCVSPMNHFGNLFCEALDNVTIYARCQGSEALLDLCLATAQAASGSLALAKCRLVLLVLAWIIFSTARPPPKCSRRDLPELRLATHVGNPPPVAE